MDQEQQECFSIFTDCCYLHANNRQLINKDITVASEASNHSRIAAYTCIMKIINKNLDLHSEMFTDEIPLIIWGDGCAAYLRSSFVFHLFAQMDKKFKVEWCYNERHHGKGTMGVI